MEPPVSSVLVDVGAWVPEQLLAATQSAAAAAAERKVMVETLLAVRSTVTSKIFCGRTRSAVADTRYKRRARRYVAGKHRAPAPSCTFPQVGGSHRRAALRSSEIYASIIGDALTWRATPRTAIGSLPRAGRLRNTEDFA
jgi:hypothetical protein